MGAWSSLVNNTTALAVATVTVSVLGVTLVYLSRRKPKKFELVGRVSALNCYPVKSCGGITSKTAYCTSTGMKILNARDRHFVVVRENGDFVTQRQIPRMAGIIISCDGDELVLNANEMPELRVPMSPKLDRSKIVPCRVWKSHLEAQDCGQEVTSWLSEYLGENLRLLVLVDGLGMRQSSCKKATRQDKIAFPDDGPFHLATEESLADLQSRIGAKPEGVVTMKHFRPNIVIKGTAGAWDEDSWTHLKIGDRVEMRILAPCDRCIMTTVDSSKLEKRSDEEPLKTLRSFRTFPEVSKSPLFGIFAGIDKEGSIQVGDPVFAVRK